jgi:hypothetical protein
LLQAISKAHPNAVYAGSVPYLMLAGNVMAGWQMAPSPAWLPDAKRRDAKSREPSCTPKSPRHAFMPTIS